MSWPVRMLKVSCYKNQQSSTKNSNTKFFSNSQRKSCNIQFICCRFVLCFSEACRGFDCVTSLFILHMVKSTLDKNVWYWLWLPWVSSRGNSAWVEAGFKFSQTLTATGRNSCSWLLAIRPTIFYGSLKEVKPVTNMAIKGPV